MICVQCEDQYFELKSYFCIDDFFNWLEKNGIKYETDSAGEGPYTTHIVSLKDGSDYMATRLAWT